MTRGAVVFMAASWLLVLGLTAWSYARVLRPDRARRRGDGGTGGS